MKNFPWKNVLTLLALIFACALLARALTHSETIEDYVEKNQANAYSSQMLIKE